jgi:galactonate dehydratase
MGVKERLHITGLKTFLVGAEWRNWVVVKIETDAGIVGLGEGTLEGREQSAEAVIQELSRYLVGKDAFTIERHFQELYRRAFWTGGALLNSAISAVEQALWDIKGKALGVPVYELLGGKVRDRVKPYANSWYPSGGTPEEFAEAARKTVALGFRGLKFNPFMRREGWDFYRLENAILHTSVDCVAAVREAVGPDVDLFIDCNGVFNSTANAVRAGQALEPYNIGFIEEPIPHENFQEMAYVRRKVNIPVATGERLFTIFSYQQLLDLQAVDIVQPDLCHCGGILEARKIAAIADAHYVPVAPHSPNGPIGYAATLQLAACVPNFLVLEQGPAEPWAFEIVPQSAQYRFEDGFLEIPDRPGLGVDFDEEAAANYPYQARDLFNLHLAGKGHFYPTFEGGPYPGYGVKQLD